MLADSPNDTWTEIMAVATLVMALPTVWGIFVLIRGTFRRLRDKWVAYKVAIGLAAVAAADHERELNEAAKIAEREAEERRKKHDKAEAEQAQYNHLVLDLQKRLDEVLKPQTETIVSIVKEESGKAVSSSVAAKLEAENLRSGIERLEVSVMELKAGQEDHATKLDKLDKWSEEHSVEDRENFAKVLKNGNGNGNEH